MLDAGKKAGMRRPNFVCNGFKKLNYVDVIIWGILHVEKLLILR
jgi:hypothetical protein